MANDNSHWILLEVIVLLQLLFSLGSFFVGKKIKNLFPRYKKNYRLRGTEHRSYVEVDSASADMVSIKDDINSYLKNHYELNKIPDISQVGGMVRERSRIHDGLAGFLATVPILLGLAGTVTALFFAFFKFQDSKDSSVFLELITRSSSIAFIGTLSGITFTVLANFFISLFKKTRDVRLGNFVFFLNSKLSPTLPTLNQETVTIVADSLNKFSQEYFSEFGKYAAQFRQINSEIGKLYEHGFKEVMERNTESLKTLNSYIDKLDALHTVSREITLKPEMVNEFSKNAAVLVGSLNSSSSSHNENINYLQGILDAYQKLEERIHKSVVDLSEDRQTIGDLGKAIRNFLSESVTKLESFSKISETFNENFGSLSTEYNHVFGSVKSKLIDQVEKNFDTKAYADFSEKILAIQISVEKESENISDLAKVMASLNEGISNSLVPAFKGSLESLDKTNKFLRDELPRTIGEMIKTNERMVVCVSENLLGRPRSWGQWTFMLAGKLLGKKKTRQART